MARQTKPKLLAGGNPQIARADGDAPVQAYIAALPGWKRDIAARVDALVTRTLPGVHKAVKWNSPFYGTAKHGWFLSVHAFTRYMKLSFFNGASLKPQPPVGSKHPDVRYLDVREGEPLDEKQLGAWVTQAAGRPGWGAAAPPKDAKKAKGASAEAAKNAKAAKKFASAQIDTRIKELGDWRGETLARVRGLIRAADPAIVEEWKWDGPVWSRDGIICTGETYKKAVKLTFAKGASVPDPEGLFNSSLGGNTRRAIDIPEGSRLDEKAFKALIRAAVTVNRGA